MLERYEPDPRHPPRKAAGLGQLARYVAVVLPGAAVITVVAGDLSPAEQVAASVVLAALRLGADYWWRVRHEPDLEAIFEEGLRSPDSDASLDETDTRHP